ncbi:MULTISPECIES: hypothetical protein [Nocardia]|uniref:hypothetical protein n=1 Tax=Nocardia TaxID=1817 RepID=UPI001356869A|nr:MULTISPECIES: hypothetical protein [Nocardia]
MFTSGAGIMVSPGPAAGGEIRRRDSRQTVESSGATGQRVRYADSAVVGLAGPLSTVSRTVVCAHTAPSSIRAR